jgi:5-methylcytosine-specific restriction enzyme B
MALPDVSAEALRHALQRFDAEFRGTAEYADWESRLAYKYAIEVDGKRYPVKKVISIATGVPTSTFSGGAGANNYVAQRGLSVVELHSNAIHDGLESILADYAKARSSETFSSQAPIARVFDRVRRLLSSSDILERFTTIKVKASYGQGNWAKVPWIAFLDSRETDSTQKGVYPVILFRQDCSGLYVTFNQGVTEPQERLGTQQGLAELRGNAKKIRAHAAGQALATAGYELDDAIDLEADPGLGRDYEASTIAYKFYEKGELPPDAQIIRDVQAVLDAYVTYLASPIAAPAGPPICLIGTSRSPEQWAARAREAISRKGAWAYWWSFPIKPEARTQLVVPFELYINTGGGTFPLKFTVVEYETSQGSAGLVTPWPDITDQDEIGKTREGDTQDRIFKTWFRASAVTPIDPPLHLDDFEPVPDLSTVKNLLNPSTFGYARLVTPQDRAMDVVPPEMTMDDLVRQTHLDKEALQEIIDALKGGQVVLAGPPGTSKTFIAKCIAQYICQRVPDSYRLVQFHPSYSYESFIQGLRPSAGPTGITFELQDGVILEVVAAMRKQRHDGVAAPPYIVVIDEMNRANLPRVFGELMFLFEYRDEAMRLQYSGTPFTMPPNLSFIGTMNTADKSIRSLDSALRRRFDVFEFPPSSAILERFFRSAPPNVPKFIAGFERLNAELADKIDRHHTIGHVFFMRPRIDYKQLRTIWQRKIYPLIEEYFFDEPDVARTFTVDRFWPEVPG